MVNLEDLVIEEAFNLGLKCIISRKKKKSLQGGYLRENILEKEARDSEALTSFFRFSFAFHPFLVPTITIPLALEGSNLQIFWTRQKRPFY